MRPRRRDAGPAAAFVLLVIALEIAHAWPVRDHALELDPVALAYGVVMLLGSAIAIGLVVGSVRRGLVFVAVAWTCLCLVSIAKRRYLGAPLYPWDLLRAREVVGIWDELPGTLQASAIAALVALAAAFAACVTSLIQAARDVKRWAQQLLVGAVVAIVLLLPFTSLVRSWIPGPGNALAVLLHLRNVRWWPEDNYRVNGFTAGFLISLDVLQIPRPPVTPASLPPSCAPDAPPTLPVVATPDTPPPDVIVLLLESFFDPLTLGIPFSRDPIPFLRQLMHASEDAELHSTLWAHGTANAEFEILTGLSTAFLPPDSVVFFHYLHAPIVSLATELARVGYRTEAVHPNAGWFYARRDAYRWLGFDRAWFQEDFIPPREARGRISDDRVFFAKLRERLAATDGTPLFLWGVTLGTHGPYAPTRAARCDLGVGKDVDPTGPGSFPTLRTYSCLLERLDRRLSEFVAALDARGKPYVLFAYGDHLPPLGDALDAYRDPIGADAPYGGPRYSRTPLLLATNTDAVLPRGYHGGFNFLAPAILRAAGVAPRCQFALLDPLHARVDLVHAGLLASDGMDASLRADVQNYWALTYHLLLEPGR